MRFHTFVVTILEFFAKIRILDFSLISREPVTLSTATMASLRNAIPQRTYRERAQPKNRERLGLLEKHKDYSARARDYNEKKKRLKILREKATNRNPDEFHFGMMSSKTKNGVKIGDRGNKALSQEVVKLMKTQDAGYLRTVREKIRRQRERLEEVLQLRQGEEGQEIEVLGREEASHQNHTVFVEDEEEQRSYIRPAHRTISEAEAEQPVPIEEESQTRRHKSQKQKDAEARAQIEARNQRKKMQHSRQVRKAKLEALKIQEEQLLVAEQELDKQRSQMNNTVGGVNRNGTKFKIRERKR